MALLGISGSFLLALILPMGALQNRAEQMDWSAVPNMTAVAIPVYSSPLLVMSQLGGMFDHGNSPGAAFVLLILGAGLNLATVVWFMYRFGVARVLVWLLMLVAISMAIGWGVDRPLITPGVRPAGHTHAFDIYTNPYLYGDSWSVSQLKNQIEKTTGMAELAAASLLGLLLCGGLVIRLRTGYLVEESNWAVNTAGNTGTLHRNVSPGLAGVVALAGLVAFSIVGCYAWYPAPKETMEELAIAKSETLSAALSGDAEHALRWLPIWEDWIRKLEVGYAIRKFELRPYQQIQSFIVREKLELLEHELEHLTGHGHAHADIREICMSLEQSSRRLNRAFAD